MTSISDRLLVVIGLAFSSLAGCAVERPPDPPPFDCARIDRAEERFPEECGKEVSEVSEDAGVGDGG